MKGQYRVLLEIIFILIGILITGYVLSTFDTLQNSVNKITIEDNFNVVANNALNALLKASASNYSLVRFAVPPTISGHTYKILVDPDGNSILVVSLKNININATRKIFNITSDRIVKSEAISSSIVIEAVSEGGMVRIRRAPGDQV
jgi:hypothetical protein